MSIMYNYNSTIRRFSGKLSYKTLLSIGAIVIICAFIAIAALAYLLRDSVSNNLKLKQSGLAIQAQMEEKEKALLGMEEKLKELDSEIGIAREENDKTLSDLKRFRRKLLRKTVSLNRKLREIKNMSLESFMKEAIEKDERPDVKTALANILIKVERIMAGDIVALEPIVVTKPREGASKEAVRAAAGSYTIIALDARNSLIAINAGRNDGIKEGDKLTIIGKSGEMASASVIAVRYRVSSAFIDQMRRNYTIKDIKEGDEIIVAEKK